MTIPNFNPYQNSAKQAQSSSPKDRAKAEAWAKEEIAKNEKVRKDAIKKYKQDKTNGETWAKAEIAKNDKARKDAIKDMRSKSLEYVQKKLGNPKTSDSKKGKNN